MNEFGPLDELLDQARRLNDKLDNVEASLDTASSILDETVKGLGLSMSTSQKATRQQLTETLDRLRDRATTSVRGEDANGHVCIELGGLSGDVNVTIDPELLKTGDVEEVQFAIKTAMANALRNSRSNVLSADRKSVV